MKGKIRVFLVLVVVVAMFAMMVPAAMAATEGSVNGSFGINTSPTVDSVSLTPTAMTPQVQYPINGTVSDSDTINDLQTVVFKMWYDADGGTPTEAEFNAATANVKNCVVVIWTHTGGTSSTLALTPASSTWGLGACTVPTTAGDFSGTSFLFQIVVTDGKTATATTAPALWQIGAKATDSASQTGWNKDAEGSEMNWYGEITVPATTVNFGNLPPGTDFGASSQKALGVTVKYLANGPYDEKVKSTATWAGAFYTATLDPTGVCANAQEFALKADDTATLGTAVLVDTLGVVIDDTGVQTSEAGDLAASNNLWLKLSPNCNKDLYNSTITYGIINGT